jgi:hypothetical protein
MSSEFSVSVSRLDGTATVRIAGELHALVDLGHAIPPEAVR